MTDGTRLRLMTYNLKGLKLDRSAAVEVVRTARPDVLGVQEPPRGPAGRWRLRRFGADTGLVPVVNGRGARTTALLVAPGHTVTEARPVRLPWRVGTTRRGVSVASVDGVRVVVVHLSLHRVERAEHVDLVVDATVPAPGGSPTVVMGDLNELPAGAAWKRLGEVLTDVAPDGDPTFPAGAPRKRIDGALVTDDLTVESVHVPDGEAARTGSDHRPVVVDLVLGGGPAPGSDARPSGTMAG